MDQNHDVVQLRIAAEITQNQIENFLSVSRHSTLKSENGKELSQKEKKPEICGVFKFTFDRAFDESEFAENNDDGSNKYFGTDGFRGEANVGLTSIHAYKVGRFLGWYYSNELSGSKANHRPKIVIGKDTRRSSYMIEYSIVAGITASGADAYMLHVTTTPSVSYVTAQEEFDCGIMITASHNPFYDNGIKVVNKYGEKLDDKTTALIEAYLDRGVSALGIEGEDLPLAIKEKIGCIIDYSSGRNRYLGYLISLASHSYKNLKIGLDCANGASWMIAKSVFDALGAQITVIGAEPDGLNVNENSGSTHIENLCELVKEKHLDVGFAFDGDADRCIAVDANGQVVDGDKILYLLGKRLKSKGMLTKDTVVATVMSNSGFFKSLEKIGINCVQTNVGDRFVYECMQENGYAIGGEQSGHIIIKKYATTGDGILTAIMITEEICDSKQTLCELVSGVKIYPQYVENVKVKDKEAVFEDKSVMESLKEVEKLLDDKGRVLLRRSGTEPVVRIMVECEKEEKCVEYALMIKEKILSGGHSIE